MVGERGVTLRKKNTFLKKINCQSENIITFNIISLFKTLKVGKKNQLLFLLEEDVKNHGIQVIKTTAIGRENEKKKTTKTPILNYFVLKPFQCRIPGSNNNNNNNNDNIC